MQLALNTDQEQLRDAFDKVLRTESTPARVRAAEPLGHDAKLWDGLVAFGVPMMRVPEEAGGLGIGLLDASLIAEVAGRHLASAPVIESIVATHLLAELGGDAEAWLHRVSQGEVIVTLALHEPDLKPSQLVPGARSEERRVGKEC